MEAQRTTKIWHEELPPGFAGQVADEEPRPGEISRESFSEIAGIYVYNALYL